jgi:hypothetical protein
MSTLYGTVPHARRGLLTDALGLPLVRRDSPGRGSWQARYGVDIAQAERPQPDFSYPIDPPGDLSRNAQELRLSLLYSQSN